MFVLKNYKQYLVFALICLVLSGCSSFFKSSSSASKWSAIQCDENLLKTPVVKDEKKSQLGNPLSYQVFDKTYYPMRSLNKGYSEEGLASWYGPNFANQKTSTGEVFNPCELTAAHRTIPIPSYFLVQNLQNGKEVVVKVNDRGPFIKPNQRIIDLSYMAAKKLGFAKQGVGKVKITSLSNHSFTNAYEVIQAGSFDSYNHAKQAKNKIKSIRQILDDALIHEENNQYKLLVLSDKQSLKELSNILNSYKIEHFITTIHQ